MFKFGDLIRFIPYPVIGGFLAGSGWLLIQGSIQVMTDVPLSWGKLPFFFQIDVLLRWLPGVIFAVSLFALARRWSHFSIMPASLAAATGLFYAWLLLTNTSVALVSAHGWLLGPFSQGNLWQPLSFSALTKVNWSAIFNQLSGTTTIMVISAATILLNASGLELMAQRDINLNRELKAAGIANIVSGLGGGMVGYHVLSDSALAYRMGARSRLVGLLTAVFCAIVLVQGPSLLSFVPKFLLGGLLLFLGLLFLVELVIRRLV